ncbi:DUF4148 domain-containing protein [Paraburkholderia sp. BL10I2N1]|uniref:DUF4148 domain-containing protein n=1 Tax=Paraburkholderia sp. BL10I2N1 TaxID=1938796 RepID=UPI00105FE94B|nr:DUF4148 domain-containing protein [Paraburkholderia sp. BL10I2N1]TDN61583.1 uncharacterized protein DUF4148 [Paraburkholderia sp. BL10I2N1]
MNTLFRLPLAISALVIPALSFAQSAAPLTRAQVYEDLVRVEQAGYNPGASDDANYPSDIQAAEAKIAAQNGDRTTNEAVGGASPNGTSQAGTHASGMTENPVDSGQ